MYWKSQLVTIEELIALECCDNPRKFESFNLQSKNLVYKGVDFYVQNAL